MEWVAVLKAVEVALEVAPGVIGAVAGVCGAVYGLWKSAKARQWEKSSDDFEGLLSALVAAVEMLPRDERTKQIKQAIDRIQRYSGQHSDEWVELVKQIELVVRKSGLNDRADDVAALSRAADAVARSRADRKSGMVLMGGFPALLLVAGLCASISGCVAVGPERLTRETVWPAEVGAYPAEIVVEWPEGVRKGDVRTWEIEDWGDTRTLSTAPMPEAAVPVEGTP
jgi:hypothetical protein